LIQNGHRLRDIERYTIAQARCFLAVIDQEEARRDLMLLQIACVPHDGKFAGELIKQLEKRIK
jgi:hypothetical protein